MSTSQDMVTNCLTAHRSWRRHERLMLASQPADSSACPSEESWKLPSNHSTWLSPSKARICVAMRSTAFAADDVAIVAIARSRKTP